MNKFLVLISLSTILLSCTGFYTKSKCEGRMVNLKGIEGKYEAYVEDENQAVFFDIIRKGAGVYNLVANGEPSAEIHSCIINNTEVLEFISDKGISPFLRNKKKISSINFDQSVLDNAGVEYETATSAEWGFTVVSITGEISDDVLIQAARPGEMVFIKK